MPYPLRELLNNTRNPDNKDWARQLRRRMSASECVLWGLIRKDRLGFRFRRQVPIGPFVLDFYCPEASLCVEVDGEQHCETVARDRVRDAFMAERGIETVRVPSLWLFDPARHAEATRLVTGALERKTGRKPFDIA